MMQNSEILSGKRILFLAPAFFGYENKIKDKMVHMGAVVDFFDERSVTKALDRALLKIAPYIFKKKTSTYYNGILEKCKNNKYDYVFVIKCDMMSEEILEKFHHVFPDAVFCLYLYDSVENIKGVKKKFRYFSRIFSFDRKDTKSYPEMEFRPLFYLDDFKKDIKTDNKYKYDISFCGTIHSDRYSIIRDVMNICIKNGLRIYTFCYLQSKFMYYFYKLIKQEYRYAKKTDFSFVKASSKEIHDIVDESRVVLDIQHPKQTGLTMRTIEMIGMNKKLITTNAEIKRYDFYNPNNILVIDRTYINIPEGFMTQQYEILNKDIYDRYSIETWIKDILYSTK